MSSSDFDDDSDEFEDFGFAVKPIKKAAAPKAAPVAKAAPKAAPKKKTVLGEQDMNAMDDEEEPAAPKAKAAAAKKTIEEEYKKMDPREHVLLRPDMYIGAVTKTSEQMWVYDEGQGLVFRKIEYAPGLYKIFDELLVNAADNYQRDRTQTTIKVEIDADTNSIVVFNDGRGIPVTVHAEHKKYVPEMIFGELLTGSNFDDKEAKVTGGRNGLGAKLANIYSKEFIVETASAEYGKRFKQVFKNNMTSRSEPAVTPSKENWTRITFKPDLARFDMTELDADMLGLMRKRVWDVAGCNSTLKVYLNNVHLKVKNFTTYAQMFLESERKASGPSNPLDGDSNAALTTCTISQGDLKRWEISVGVSDGEQKQMSFVNSIWTIRGGTHVAAIADKVAKHLAPALKKKNKGEEIKPFFIKNNMWIFVNSLIDNPSFDSQTKETLKSKPSDFGSKLELPDDFLKKLEKSALVEQVLKYALLKGKMSMMKQGGTKKKHVSGVEKLVDANMAGSKNSSECTLILTEGDSAKALAIAGMSVVGRDRYGVFPLRGKLINVRDAKATTILKNEEVKSIIQIMGLKPHTKYEDTKSLRYGSVMIMTDQDHDGSHIKGLIINFFHSFWPELMRMPGFLTEFITPIVKATKGQREISFFSTPEYEKWREDNDAKGWKIKYYKGLGTSTSEEAREYFSNLGLHKKQFSYNGEEDDKAIVMAFGKSGSGAADERKEWIAKYTPGTYLDHRDSHVAYDDFVYKELVLFSIANCQRAIPSVVDGLKPGQRKILFACFKRNLTKEIRVAQLSGYISEVAAYHHGEVSLQSAIVAMAQNYIGSNNVNMLQPQGQFGTRLEGGKDAASARYIHTHLTPLARLMFSPLDDEVLKYLEEDGLAIEPEWFMPVVPFVLMNGNKGIGTGWSSNIPNFNPRDVIAQLRRLMASEPLETIHPWYRGFQGRIDWQAKGSQYKVSGIWRRLDDRSLEVTELPVGYWTQSFKVLLDSLLENSTEKDKDADKAASAPLVSDYDDHSTECRVHFRITIPTLAQLSDTEVEKQLGLNSTLTVSNMHFYDHRGQIVKYDDVNHIMREFFHLRLAFYGKRKEFLVAQLQSEHQKLSNQVRFIRAVIAKELNISNRKKRDIIADLVNQRYTRFPPKKVRKGDAENEDGQQKEGGEEVDLDESERDFDYLLGMKLWSLTLERVQKLEDQLASKKAELDALLAKSPEDLWGTDLDQLEAAWDAYEAAMADFENSIATSKDGKKKKMPVVAAPKAKAPVKPAKVMLMEEDDDFEEGNRGTKRKLGATATKAAALLELGDESDDFEVDDEDTPPKKAPRAATKTTATEKPAAPALTIVPAPAAANAPKPAPIAKAAPVTKPAPKPAAAAPKPEPKKPADEDEEEYLSLNDRLKKGGAAAKTTAAKPALNSMDLLTDIFGKDSETFNLLTAKAAETKKPAAPAPAPKKVEAPAPAPKKVAPKPATPPKSSLPVIDDDDFSGENCEDEPLSLSPKVTKPKKANTFDDDFDSLLSLTPSKQARANKVAAAKKADASKSTASKKALKDSEDDDVMDIDDSSDEAFDFPAEKPALKKAAPAPKAAAPVKKAPAPAPAAKPKAAPAAKPAAAKKKSLMDSDDEDAMEVDEAPKKAAPKPAAAPAPAPARNARAAAAKKATYKEESEEEEEFSEEESSSFESGESEGDGDEELYDDDDE